MTFDQVPPESSPSTRRIQPARCSSSEEGHAATVQDGVRLGSAHESTYRSAHQPGPRGDGLRGREHAHGPNTNIGQLTISFTAPSGVNTAATVTGPGGYSSTVTTNTTLGSLAPGSYTITPVSVRRVGPIVDEFYDGSVTGAATVSNSATATSSVTFAKRGGSGNLWLPGCEKGTARGGVNSYDPSTFDPSMTPSPAIILSNGTCAEGAAFDAAGNLWISDYNLKISMYTPAQLATNLSPSVVLTNPADPTTSFNKPTDLAFDRNGNLWVANY